MTTLYLVHTETKRKYKVLGVDKEKNIITLEGEHATFEETYDPARLRQLGYTMQKEETA